MQGEILGFDSGDDTTVILGKDGKRYKFSRHAWKEANMVEKGMEVDFNTIDQKAEDVYLVKDNSKNGWLANMSKFEKYFWATILLLAILFLIAQAIAYVNTKQVSENRNNHTKLPKKSSSGSVSDVKFSKQLVSKSLDLKVKELYHFIDRTITEESLKKENFSSLLDTIHLKYIQLLKKHLIFIDKSAMETANITSELSEIGEIYSKLHNSKTIQPSKKKIDASSFNDKTIGSMKHVLKAKYHEQFVDITKEVYVVFFDTLFKKGE